MPEKAPAAACFKFSFISGLSLSILCKANYRLPQSAAEIGVRLTIGLATPL